jgi:hypothetical protein
MLSIEISQLLLMVVIAFTKTAQSNFPKQKLPAVQVVYTKEINRKHQ